jgi:hypothetical protein
MSFWLVQNLSSEGFRTSRNDKQEGFPTSRKDSRQAGRIPDKQEGQQKVDIIMHE